jgi:hypothetical protein
MNIIFTTVEDQPKEREYLLKLVFCFAGFGELKNNMVPPEGCQGFKGFKGLSPYDFLRREVRIDRN